MIKDIKIEGIDAFKDALVAMKGGSLPAVTESDEGKILKVEEGAAAWADPELPEITESDEGKFLTVNQGVPAWGEASSGGPSFIFEDGVYNVAGDVTFHNQPNVSVNFALKTYIFEYGVTKYSKTFDITLPTADADEHARPVEIISAWAACDYNGTAVNIPCMIWNNSSSPTQMVQLCFDTADGQMDIPNTGIYVKRIYITGYGAYNVSE